jgi:hypothetical protein
MRCDAKALRNDSPRRLFAASVPTDRDDAGGHTPDNVCPRATSGKEDRRLPKTYHPRHPPKPRSFARERLFPPIRSTALIASSRLAGSSSALQSSVTSGVFNAFSLATIAGVAANARSGAKAVF